MKLKTALLGFVPLMVLASLASAAEVKILLPLGRVAYQTNEVIDLTVHRTSAQALPASELSLTLISDDASRIVCTFPAGPVALDGAEARATEHLRLNGWLLRPGKYTIEVAVDGAAAKADIEVYSHIRSTSFKLIDWGSRAKDQEQALLGEKGLGFNILFAHYGGISADNMIRGGLDYMRCCTMNGGHQMDLRSECDWSDPYVLQGAAARVTREALACRTNPNALGVHFYDEPGLTWAKHPKSGLSAPYNLIPHDRSYKSAFDLDPIQYTDVNPDDPAAVARWNHLNRWKLSFLDAAWKYSQFGVTFVRPDLLSVNQSVYGVTAYADGYYFNAVRSLPILSGHGGYSDWGAGYWNPSWTFEFGRMRDLAKPAWYLPTWAGNMPSNQFRMEQYLSFMTNLQGMCKPPDAQVHKPQTCAAEADGIVESNKLLAQLGTIFTTMPLERGDVAVLYSLSHILHAQIRDMQKPDGLQKSAYEGGGHSRTKCLLAYLAGKIIHTPLFPIVEEDILDGTLAAHHKALVIPGVDYLEPKVIATLEAYIAAGGAVLLSDDCKVKIKGATPIGCALTTEAADRIAQLHREKKADEANKLETTNYYVQAAAPFAKALQAKLAALSIVPALDVDSPGIITQRQAYGDIEYLFAVNATYDEKAGTRNSIKPAIATLSVVKDERPIYDAVRGGPAPEFKEDGDRLKATLRFGPGQMRVFARTNKQIGGVDVPNPLITRDFTLPQSPLRLNIAANVVDTHQALLNASIPLHIRIVDPLGVVRYELYRATRQGVLQLSLPLAANDPAGDWKVIIRELVNRTQGQNTFSLKPATQCGAIAGRLPRAHFFDNDRENAFRFFRLHRNVTIVKGTSDYNTAAAQRLEKILKPWNIRCTIVNAADIKPREISPEERTTWVGLDFGRINPDEKPGLGKVGAAISEPAILLGTPEDNPLIKFIRDQSFLPYKPDKAAFPGKSRGLLAWQRDAISYGNESITLIAYDAAGMSEAVGSLYEAAAALDPLTPLDPPTLAQITPATKSTARAPEAKIAWRTLLPDRALTLQVDDSGRGVILTNDGSLITLDKAGKLIDQKPSDQPLSAIQAPPTPALPDPIARNLAPNRIPKLAISKAPRTAVAYWGGTLEVFNAQGAVTSSTLLPHDITALAWLGDRLLVAQSDGTILLLVSR